MRACGIGVLTIVLVATAVNADFVLDVTDPYEAFLAYEGDSPLELEGYTIASQDGLLDPMGFCGFECHALMDPVWPPPWLPGWMPLVFDPYPGTTHNISELWVSGSLSLQPGFRMSIGNCAPNGTVADLSFKYASGDATYDAVVIPEPATMALLAMGGLAALRCRR